MKWYLPLLLCCLLGASAAFAQENKKTTYMTVAIISYDAWPQALARNKPGRLLYITTLDDGTQTENTIVVPGLLQRRTADRAYENGQMQILKQYFDQGWKLVTSSSEVYSDVNNTIGHVINRYFLSKQY